MVHKKYENLGIGKMLVKKAEQEARKLKLKRVLLSPASKSLEQFWKHIGYKRKTDLYIMEKLL